MTEIPRRRQPISHGADEPKSHGADSRNPTAPIATADSADDRQRRYPMAQTADGRRQTVDGRRSTPTADRRPPTADSALARHNGWWTTDDRKRRQPESADKRCVMEAKLAALTPRRTISPAARVRFCEALLRPNVAHVATGNSLPARRNATTLACSPGVARCEHVQPTQILWGRLAPIQRCGMHAQHFTALRRVVGHQGSLVLPWADAVNPGRRSRSLPPPEQPSAGVNWLAGRVTSRSRGSIEAA
jgi:hypothetical protein